MTTATTVAATITGTLLTLAPIPPQAIRDAHCTDCLASWEGLPDTTGGFTFAYAA